MKNYIFLSYTDALYFFLSIKSIIHWKLTFLQMGFPKIRRVKKKEKEYLNTWSNWVDKSLFLELIKFNFCFFQKHSLIENFLFPFLSYTLFALSYHFS